MKSGLEDRNNAENVNETNETAKVSMKSGLEDRNNPDQSPAADGTSMLVSMKSGLEDRNNPFKGVELEWAKTKSQ